jgi:hypothetical protein
VVLVRILFTLIPVLTRNSVLVALVEVLDNRLVAFSSTSPPPVLVASAASLCACLRCRIDLEIEVLALRHQLAVVQHNAPKRPRVSRADRLLWVLLSKLWPNWRKTLQIVKPATVVRWQRCAFAGYWRWKSRPRRDGRLRSPTSFAR